MSDEHVNLAHARTHQQAKVMERIIRDGRCPFCRENFLEYHTKEILFETDHWLVTPNFEPYKGSKLHLILVPREHCTSPEELTPVAWADLQDVVKRVRAGYETPGGSLWMRFGDTEYTGASVRHLHAQLIVGASRKEGGEMILTALGYKDPKQRPAQE